MEKYTLNLDENNFILSIAHTINDDTELDLSKIELKFLNAYQLIDGEVVLNEERYNELKAEEEEIEKQIEIADLEEKLNETDYIIARWGEEIVALDNPLTWIADAIKINIKYATKYKETFANRKTWRERIEELRNA